MAVPLFPANAKIDMDRMKLLVATSAEIVHNTGSHRIGWNIRALYTHFDWKYPSIIYMI